MDERNICSMRAVPAIPIFAWSVKPQTGRIGNSEGSASDGELYFVTDLLFASNRWGNNTGTNYYAEARGFSMQCGARMAQTSRVTNVINVEQKKITFVPDSSGYNSTDPSYFLPAFFEIGQIRERRVRSSSSEIVLILHVFFLHRACASETGLNADATEFSGAPRKFRNWSSNFLL